jgi:sn-glycerol 3-phosphate transport system substrate-binding protein
VERRDFLALMGLGALGAGLAACSSPPASTKPPNPHGFPIGAAAASKSKPVSITLWHSMTSANLAALVALTNSFNRSQGDIRVNLVNQDSYASTLSEYTRATSTGTLPDLVQMDGGYLQQLIDSRRIVPVQEAIEADGYDISDFVVAALESFRVSDAIWAIPFNCSVQVLYYDKAALRRASLDPDSPPQSMTEMIDASKSIVSHGSEKFGMSLKMAIANFDQWVALGGQTIVNNANGRDARATAVNLQSAGTNVFSWLSEMFKNKFAQAIPQGSSNNLLAIGNQVAPMTIDSSESLGTVTQILRGYDAVDLAIAPVPNVLAPAGTGGVVAQGGGLHLVHGSSPARLDASWQYAKFLASASSQTSWAAKTGFIPVRKSASQMPPVATAWAATPGFRVAYEQLLSSPGTPVTSVPVVGAATQLISSFETAMANLAAGKSPGAELFRAVEQSNSAIAAYNARH